MQLYIVTWKFASSEDQLYSSQALVEYVESGRSEELVDGYERIAWAHTPQDGTGVIICRAVSASILYAQSFTIESALLALICSLCIRISKRLIFVSKESNNLSTLEFS